MKFIVKDNDDIIGISGIYVEPFEPNTAWLGWYGVKSKYRRMGYGTQILNRTIEIAKQSGFKFFRLYTDIVNPNAHRLYDKVMDFCEEYTEQEYHLFTFNI